MPAPHSTSPLLGLREYARLPDRTPKADGLFWLIRHGAKVPETYVWPSVEGRVPGSADFVGLDRSAQWAVRSSASAEDGPDTSHAGQFTTKLGVSGADALATAARDVIASLSGARAESYAGAVGRTSGRMDVIVQKMLAPRIAGVAFSRNPLTGLNEVVVEAVEGLGERLVGEGRTPERWVWRGGSFSERPDAREGDDAVAAQVALETVRLAREYGRPVDLEWAYDRELWFLQIRPITGLDTATVYSNRISREVMPGLIKPLVWSINVPLVNAAWIRLIERAVGPSGLEPFGLARQFGFRSYFNMSALGHVFELMGFPYDSLEIMLGLPNSPRPRISSSWRTLQLLPRLAGFATYLLSYGRRFEQGLAEVRLEFAALGSVNLEGLSNEALMAHFDRLLGPVGRAAELNIVAPLLANLYGAMLRRQLERAGIDAAEVEVTPGRTNGPPEDIPGDLHQLWQLARRNGLKDGEALRREALGEEFVKAFSDFLDRYGHFSDSGNDLSVPPWRETSNQVLKMVELAGSKPTPRGRLAYSKVREKIRGPRLALVDFVYHRASRFQGYRDAISSAYTLGYGLLRPVALEFGRRLVRAGVIAESEDVMFLTLAEMRDGLSGGAPLHEAVATRRSSYAEAKHLVLPETIYGDDFQPRPARPGKTRLVGVGSSRGQHRGRLRVLRSLDDFAKVQSGDIIVIPYSDVGWTPVFARAGAVVAEAGGMLSHSSIIAREFGIPCVVSVNGAMQLPDGEEAAVDGLSGEVMVLGTDT